METPPAIPPRTDEAAFAVPVRFRLVDGEMAVVTTFEAWASMPRESRPAAHPSTCRSCVLYHEPAPPRQAPPPGGTSSG